MAILFVIASTLPGQNVSQPKRDTAVRSKSQNGGCVSTQGLDHWRKRLARNPPRALGCWTTVDLICADCRRGVEVNSPEPCFPAIAKSARASGAVEVAIVVNEKGNILWARVLRGHPLLRAAALAAALKRTFTPYTCAGRLIKAYELVVYNFELAD